MFQFPSGSAVGELKTVAPQVDTSPPAAPEIHVYAVVDERNVRRNRYHPSNLRLRTVDDNTRQSWRRRENTRFFDVDPAKLISQRVYDGGFWMGVGVLRRVGTISDRNLDSGQVLRRFVQQ